MRITEARYPCPACLGLPMQKIRFNNPQQGLELILDSCQRCGGIWFDAGEVEMLTQIHPNVAMRQIELKPEAFIMKCHTCQSAMDRNADHCPACNWHNQLDCPICQQAMSIAKVEDLKLDYCKGCKGVWFDNIELSTIWNQRLARLASQQQAGGRGFTAEDGSDLFLNVLVFSPELLYYGAAGVAKAVQHAPEIAAGAVEMIGNAPELAGNLIEGGAKLAGGIFEAIGAIIAAIFEGN